MKELGEFIGVCIAIYAIYYVITNWNNMPMNYKASIIGWSTLLAAVYQSHLVGGLFLSALYYWFYKSNSRD
jgi:hypothetical protein